MTHTLVIADTRRSIMNTSFSQQLLKLDFSDVQQQLEALILCRSVSTNAAEPTLFASFLPRKKKNPRNISATTLGYMVFQTQSKKILLKTNDRETGGFQDTTFKNLKN